MSWQDGGGMVWMLPSSLSDLSKHGLFSCKLQTPIKILAYVSFCYTVDNMVRKKNSVFNRKSFSYQELFSLIICRLSIWFKWKYFSLPYSTTDLIRLADGVKCGLDHRVSENKHGRRLQLDGYGMLMGLLLANLEDMAPEEFYVTLLSTHPLHFLITNWNQRSKRSWGACYKKTLAVHGFDTWCW